MVPSDGALVYALWLYPVVLCSIYVETSKHVASLSLLFSLSFFLFISRVQAVGQRIASLNVLSFFAYSYMQPYYIVHVESYTMDVLYHSLIFHFSVLHTRTSRAKLQGKIRLQ